MSGNPPSEKADWVVGHVTVRDEAAEGRPIRVTLTSLHEGETKLIAFRPGWVLEEDPGVFVLSPTNAIEFATALLTLATDWRPTVRSDDPETTPPTEVSP